MNILSKFQLPSSYGLGKTVCWRLGRKGLLNQLISDKGASKTAPATPGLLKIGTTSFGTKKVWKKKSYDFIRTQNTLRMLAFKVLDHIKIYSIQSPPPAELQLLTTNKLKSVQLSLD